MRKRGLSDHAQRAQALDESFKSDYLLLATESLIKAVESRLAADPVRKRLTAIDAIGHEAGRDVPLRVQLMAARDLLAGIQNSPSTPTGERPHDNSPAGSASSIATRSAGLHSTELASRTASVHRSGGF